MIAGLLLLFILLAIGPIASQIPAAVLAGILITVGIGVMDYKGLKALPYMPRPEVIILIVVLVLIVHLEFGLCRGDWFGYCLPHVYEEDWRPHRESLQCASPCKRASLGR